MLNLKSIPIICLLLICLPLNTILAENPNEICDNGIDDDGDGLIDCYDPDCCGDTLCADHYYNECPIDCRFEPSNSTFDMTIDWVYNAGNWHSYNTGITGDVDGDGFPEVVGKKGPYGGVSQRPDLLVIDGQTGALEATIPTENIGWATEAVALADINKNGRAEILVITGDTPLNTFRRHIFCFEFDGTTYQQLWMSDVPTGYPFATATAAPNVADFNQDGIAEVYVMNEIFDGLTGQQLLDGGPLDNVGQTNSSKLESMVVAVDVLPDSFCPTCDGLELVAGNQVYAVNIDPLVPLNNSILVANEAIDGGDGNTAIADMDRDGDLDAVITYNSNDTIYIHVWDIQTPAALAPLFSVQSGNVGWVGLPNIADFDGNGTLEIGVCAESSYRVLSYNSAGLIPMWSVPTSDASGRTGSTVFDFEGDGDKEIVYRDQNTLRIFDGSTGAVLYSTSCGSGTSWEFPVVVDVDKDGETELLCSCDDELRAYKSSSVPWEPTRSVWNQHMYFNVNINDDMTVPAVQQQQQIVGDSMVLNNFLNQYSDPIFPAADATITVDNITCAMDSFVLDITVCNNGDNTLPSSMPITFYQGDPTASAAASSFFTGTTNAVIGEGNCFMGTVTVPAIVNTPIYVIVNDDGSIPPVFDLVTDFPSTPIAECDYSDNISSFSFDYTLIPLDLGPDLLGCEGDEFTLNAGGGYVSYDWFDGTTDSTFIVNASGTYWIEVTDECGFKQLDSVTVVIDTVNLVNLPDYINCIEDTIIISMPPFDSYNWFPKDGSIDCDTCSTVAIVPTSSTAYSVIVESELGCFKADTFEVELIDITCLINVLQHVSVYYGSDGSASVAAANGFPPYSYQWNDGQNTQVATGLSAGSYTVTINDGINCSKVCSVTILEPDPDCRPCAIAEANNLNICTVINGDSNHPWASLDCDNGGVTNGTECQNNGDPQEPLDDCSIALVSNADICQLINNNPDHPLANEDCDQGGIPNLLECQNNGNPSDPADECAVAIGGQLNICKFVNYETGHPMATLDCDAGGVENFIECIKGYDANDPVDDCSAAARGGLDICAIINNDPNHPWASLDCDDGSVINISECMNGSDPSKPSDDIVCTPNLCAEAVVGAIDICDAMTTDPNHPIGPLDCDEDGVTNADECIDGTDPLDPCDFVDTSITLPVTADQSDCPFPCPDLTPIMTILPGNIAGVSAVEAAIQITELDSVDTNGSIIIARVPSDPRLVFVWDIGLTMAALVPVQNADWNYLGDNGFVHTWTYNGPGLVIPAEGVASFGFQAVYDPQSTDGQTTITVTVLPFSGGECNALNNVDSERLVYFE